MYQYVFVVLYVCTGVLCICVGVVYVHLCVCVYTLYVHVLYAHSNVHTRMIVSTCMCVHM